MDIVAPIVIFLVICSLAAFWAAAMKRRWWVWFLIALFLTPLVAFIGLIIVFFTSGQPRRIACAVKQGPQSSYGAVTEHFSGESPMHERDRGFYTKAGSEVASKNYDQALFTKAFSESDGDENKTQALFIRYRVAELRAQRHKADQAEEETRRREEALKSVENVVVMTDQARMSSGSIWSLVLGILGIICFGPLAAIPAVICGHLALSKINKSSGALTGSGMAIAGLFLGYFCIAIFMVLLILGLLRLWQTGKW